MKETLTVWRKPRNVAVALGVGAVYAALLLPFKDIVLIPGLTTVRPANFVPVVAGLLFGPAGAWGAAAGNVVGDLFGGTWNPVSPVGALANFLGAYVPYRLWGRLGPLSTGDPPDLRSARQLPELLAVVVVTSVVLAATLGWGMEVAGPLAFSSFASVVFVSNLSVAVVFVPPVLYAVHPRVESRGLLATQTRSTDPPADPSNRSAGLALSLVAVGWLAAGLGYDLWVGRTSLPALATLRVTQTTGVLFQQALGGAALLAFAVWFAAPSAVPTPFGDRLADRDCGLAVPPVWCLYGVAVVLSGALLLGAMVVGGAGSLAAEGIVGPLVFSVGPSVVIVGVAAWLDRGDYPAGQVWRLCLWALGGLSAFVLLFGTWNFYVRLSVDGLGRYSLRTLVFDAQVGTLVGLAIGLYDVKSERRRREVVETRERLELLNRVVRHDIRNRMQVVRGRAELLSTDWDSDHLDDIVTAADDVIELTDTARSVTETTLHRDQSLEPVPLRPVLRSRVRAARAAHDARVTVDSAVPQTTVRATEMLGSVFDNFLTNAVVHNDEDDPEVTVAVEDRDETVVVTIADNGPGIPDDRKEAVFERGAQRAQSAGLGLGLYLTKALIDQYGGSVSVSDNDPKGAVFAIELQKAEN